MPQETGGRRDYDATIRQALFILRYPTTDLWLGNARRLCNIHNDITPAELAEELKRCHEQPVVGGGGGAKFSAG
jgi:hypothetical protein